MVCKTTQKQYDAGLGPLLSLIALFIDENIAAGMFRRARQAAGRGLHCGHHQILQIQKVCVQGLQQDVQRQDWNHLALPTYQMLCVDFIGLNVAFTLLDSRVVGYLPRMRAQIRLTQGMRIAKYHIDGEWECSAGRVQFTAKEVRI